MRICLIQVWIGKIPDYFWVHYQTTKNIRGIDFLFITDDLSLKIDSENYRLIYKTKEEIIDLISSKVGKNIEIFSNKKICDAKISFPDLFSDLLIDYDYVGCYDIDTLFGDMNNLESFLQDMPDYFSFSDKKYHDRIAGPFLLVKNKKNVVEQYKNDSFINSMNKNFMTSYEEGEFYEQIKDKSYVKLIYDEINVEKEGGKNEYFTIWEGGKLKTKSKEIKLYHFYRKNETHFQIVGNKIFASYDKKYLNDFYWVFGFTESYSKNIKYLLDSLHKFSNRKCVIYCINFDYELPKEYLCSKQFIVRRFDIQEGDKDNMGRDENIISLKPKLMIDVLDFITNSNFVFIDSDVFITVSADNIKEYFSKIKNYPLINSHIHDRLYLRNIVDGEEWTSTIDILSKKTDVEITVFPRRKTNVMCFNEKCRWFFEEQIEIYEKYKKTEKGIFALHDEDSANLLLSKYNLKSSLHLCDIEESSNVDIQKYTDINHPFHMTKISEFVVLPKHQNEIFIFHQLKSEKQYINICQDYCNKVIDCEEILVYYKDNCIFFEKNSFLDQKTIGDYVDFLVKDVHDTIVGRLNNQKIKEYWTFYLSNFYLEKGKYCIEILESNTGFKLYNNVLEV